MDLSEYEICLLDFYKGAVPKARGGRQLHPGETALIRRGLLGSAYNAARDETMIYLTATGREALKQHQEAQRLAREEAYLDAAAF